MLPARRFESADLHFKKGAPSMNLLSTDELKALMEKREGPCVSVFMPTHRTGPETQQDRIRFKNLLKQAEERLTHNGLRGPNAKELLEPAQVLVQDSLFWSHQSDGLAAFFSAEGFRQYSLPFNFDELVVVADRFHLKPMLPILSGDGRFYVLALSQNQVRLLQGTRYSVDDLDLDGIPRSLEAALRLDTPEKLIQWHTSMRGGTGKRSSTFHGHGGAPDDLKENLLQYLRKVDKGLHDLIGNDQAPLILAAVDYLFPIYKEANTYAHLLEQGIPGNPEGLSAQQLHAQAWNIIEPHFQQAQQDAVSQYNRMAGTGRSSKDLEVIVREAYHGRVDVLFVATGVQRWGSFDLDANAVHWHDKAEPSDMDLLDFAAIQTFLNGGTVYAVEPENVPDDRHLAAIFRY
jgi:Bacterial archaeo-eukaryotic release factor family 7